MIPPKSNTVNMENIDKEDAPKGNSEIVDFVVKLSESVVGKELPTQSSPAEGSAKCSAVIRTLINVLERAKGATERHRPEDYTGCRFGNKAHTAWVKEIRENWDTIASELGINDSHSVKLKENFLNSFGSEVRIDYGTGHEIQFALFLLGMHKEGLIVENDFSDLVLQVLSRYFVFVRYLIDRYNLEPAGSKGAWGLDHYQFLPFLLGSSQLLNNVDIVPASIVNHGERSPYTAKFIFLQAVEYIKEKVNGIPLEISSPMLNGICTSCTWRQINQGLMKMYKDDIVNIARIKHLC